MAQPKQPADRPAKAPQAPPKVPRPTPPKAPPQASVAAAVPDPPSSVIMAVRLMYAGAALSAVVLIITVATSGRTRSLLHTAEPKLTPAQLTSGTHAFIFGSIVIWLVTIGLWFVMARTNQAGRGWARVAATFLCVASTLSFAGYINQPSSVLSKAILIPMWLAGVAAVILLWQRSTTAYIRAETERLHPGRISQAGPSRR
jgi:hypothetical protein